MSKLLGIIAAITTLISMCFIDSESNIPMWVAIASLVVFAVCACINGWLCVESEDEE